MIDIYESAVEDGGRFGAVFERDDETAYLYLIEMRKEEAPQIVAAFSVDAINGMPAQVPIAVRWDNPARAVGLFVGGALLALFDLRGAEPIGRYADDGDGGLFRTH